ncbi:MAG: 3-hydroxyacyl-[acyl-carrier-protein] dehydratase FabZ [Alphaproteobacteria bacterium MarineAlpha5_Bin6]|nr:MAG: 3-hydroxyacyl-[acyl-carrier-protein] dehydratase FabZ [Alphaproteobacteria bacterium MarineAlpha5_Bin7]PPR53120.1 MAG: 3-hydroxyacyl-[acyl-carrier-protein] dehydratase FabZ [Alphaproteobacteria bacterium MarineAlpha5_Bin6]|tara:strand:+ start:1504 stop:1953 length:450 start_codon:yes stop_codon:yes gene_type:complete
MILNKKEIESLLPHRDPFLFLDSCEIIEIGVKGIGLRLFNPKEYFFEGHFPKNPIVPGVVLIESMAQTAGVVVSKGFEKNMNKSVLFMSISKAKFRRPVLPHDNVSFKVQLMNKVKSVYKFSGSAFNKDLKVCEAEFTAMITDNNKEIL